MNQSSPLLVLLVLDGWGIAPAGPGNAIALAHKPNLDYFWQKYPHTQLAAAGEAVGLPKGCEGNSETGHLNLGAGRIVYQDLPRINLAIADGSFFENPAFLKVCNHVKKQGTTLHLLGLIGAGGVHANNEHLFALLQLAKIQGLKNVILHLFTDGRDSPPTSALIYIHEVLKKIEEFKVGQIGTLMGRYWAMDRDNRWSRTEKAYLALTEGKGHFAYSAEEGLQRAYEGGETDEFISPIVIVDQSKIPVGLVKNNDGVIFYNFRVDRPRQLTKAFVLKNFAAEASKRAFDPYFEKYLGPEARKQWQIQEPVFQRRLFLPDLFFVTMTEYEKNLPVKAVAFPPQKLNLPLAEVFSEKGLSQLHLAETEKERFVTYYFNGFHDQPFPKEEWLTVPSQLVVTYDLKPEMSARELTQVALEKIKSQSYNFILINFANPDMVAHTAKLSACIKAIEVVDECVGKIVEAVLALKGTVIITADHGNAEELLNQLSGEIDTQHSANNVPFILINNLAETYPLNLPKGILGDVAPTILKILRIPKPAVMTAQSLV